MNDTPVRLILTPGDPAGIGPDLCLAVALRRWPAAIVAAADPDVLAARAARLGIAIRLDIVSPGQTPVTHEPGRLPVIATPVRVPVEAGVPSPDNAAAVLQSLDTAIHECMNGSADAMVTGPVSKAVISQSGHPFSGHTEYLATAAGISLPVMMLCAGTLRVALVTTHLPLADVAAAITADRLDTVLRVLHRGLVERFGLDNPVILVCALNPHAGESGTLGREEIDIITPVLQRLRETGLRLDGPLPADTLFLPDRLAKADAVLAMYHDQGLPVLKYAGFGHAVNVTLGLPFVRTSVDHGTAFDLAGSGHADAGSLCAAIDMAITLGDNARQH